MEWDLKAVEECEFEPMHFCLIICGTELENELSRKREMGYILYDTTLLRILPSAKLDAGKSSLISLITIGASHRHNCQKRR